MSSTWMPGTDLARLRARAQLNQTIRTFFSARSVLEVETPILSESSITDAHLGWLETQWRPEGARSGKRLFMHTSPEFAMKRLLCAGAGDIYQLCKVFRDDASGRYHNPEFTMLEWYRIGYDMLQLMHEVDALLHITLQSKPSVFMTYAQLFKTHLDVDPLSPSLSALHVLAKEKAHYQGPPLGIDECLQLLFAVCIEPALGHSEPCFVYHFPASQAALATLDATDTRVANRFEVYVNGVELANGFHELTDANEQARRFESDNQKRVVNGKGAGCIDRKFLQALRHGLPACAGVALGVDRLLMLSTQAVTMDEVLSFSIERS